MNDANESPSPSAPNKYGPGSPRPYQCFMGRWEGLCKSFTPDGEFLDSSAVHMEVSWIDDSTWHLHEHFDNLYGVGETVYDTPISVDGSVSSRPCARSGSTSWSTCTEVSSRLSPIQG